MNWCWVGEVICDQSGHQQDGVTVLRSALSLRLNESHESDAHSLCASWRKCSIYPLCGRGLNSPPLSPEFCMQAGAAMWKRGLRDRNGGWSDLFLLPLSVCHLHSLLFHSHLMTAAYS